MLAQIVKSEVRGSGAFQYAAEAALHACHRYDLSVVIETGKYPIIFVFHAASMLRQLVEQNRVNR